MSCTERKAAFHRHWQYVTLRMFPSKRMNDVRCVIKLWSQHICSLQTGVRLGARKELLTCEMTLTHITHSSVCASWADRGLRDVPSDTAQFHPSQLSKEKKENSTDKRLPPENGHFHKQDELYLTEVQRRKIQCFHLNIKHLLNISEHFSPPSTFVDYLISY